MKISNNYPKKINIKNYYIKSLKFKDNKRQITNMKKTNKKNKKVPNKIQISISDKIELEDKTKSIGITKTKNNQDKIKEILNILEIQPEGEKKSFEDEKISKSIEVKSESYIDLEKYTDEIIEYLEKEKNNNMKILEEKTIETTNQKKRSKAYTIEIEENLELNANYIYNETKEKDSPMEVKDKVFKNTDILYEGKTFIKERHQPKNFPAIINYRCKYQRKNEHLKNSNFCNALIKRKKDKNNIYYILEKNHSKECIEFSTISIINSSNLIGNYNDYINKCNQYLDSTEDYNKTEMRVKLQEIYNSNNYNFTLKENTIKNIIGRWKSNSLRFTKYNAIENRNNKNGDLILWDYQNTVIYSSNKKNPIKAEYYIWSSDQMIARCRKSKHLFIDGTFHHPKEFSQLLIIIFKDIITSNYYPSFFCLMSIKTEEMYDLVFKSIKRILTQQNIIKLDISTITTDSELALINSIENNFENSKRLGCWFHLNQDLIREAKIMGLFNKKNKNINIDSTYEVITQLSILPLNYKGDLDYIKKKINILLNQYPKYTNYIITYFMGNKLKYFEDGSYDYSKFPNDIRSNSILERYNKIIKTNLGDKRTCNWVKFMNFINNEILRINELLNKNENINIAYMKKKTKFGLGKYNNNQKEEDNIDTFAKSEISLEKNSIMDKWLIQSGNNCRYNSFITIFYFIFTSYIKNNMDNKPNLLNELADLILKLSDDVSYKNYFDIIEFLQKNKIDSNNAYIDQIINEKDEQKKLVLINSLNNVKDVDMSSSGYVAQLFSIFNNNEIFCFKESKISECIICGKKTNEVIKEMKPFVYVNINNINEKNIFNILLKKNKENYIYDCECRKNAKEDVLCTRVKYNIEKFTKFMNILFDMSYADLLKYKENIFKIAEDKIILNLNIEYKLKGIIAVPSFNHYSCIIFNPRGNYLKECFQSNLIYYHDGTLNKGKISHIKDGEDWRDLGIPYILIYQLLNN